MTSETEDETVAKFDTFLSHNSNDKPTVRQLAEALKRRGLNVWLDEWELIPGRPWQEALEKIIRTTMSAVVAVSKDGLGPWETPEMRACLAQFVERKLPVIPVLLPGAGAQPELPLFLQAFTWVDLRQGLTEDGLDRLQWGITGVKPGTAATHEGQSPAMAPSGKPPDAGQILDELTGLVAAQFERVVFDLDTTNIVPGKNVSQAERAIELVRLARTQGDEGLTRLWETIQRVKGNTP